jgi:NADH:ubiquinone oxidoreductase subunit K
MTLEMIALMGVLGLLLAALYGLLMLRNLLKMVVALQMLGKAAAFAFVLAGSISGQINLGQSLAITVIVVDTMTAVIALALAVRVRQRCGTLDVRALSALRG